QAPEGGTAPGAVAPARNGSPVDPYFTIPVPGRSAGGQAAVDPSWQPAAPPPSPGLVSGRTPDRQSEPGTVTVRAGDTLWDIAARDLGSLATDAEIAAHWPRWYAANRAVIGADPALLVPGQILTPPSGR
ncbi:LysM peptidoglycan-binding domain-containing protein, partial [Arthrobacter sp. GCM10027362]|uniref:LysM peptidoglycan-binding domain-containing protein n=1 Tax=Arthrobacter sp. GCM10027362 TaxID=3273379 RepID=UPI0036392421